MGNERSCAGIAANPRLILLLVTGLKDSLGRRFTRADGWCVEFLVTILRGHQICPAAGSNPTAQDVTRNTLLIEPRKATKGRRMSKKTRKKSAKKSLPQSSKTSAAKARHGEACPHRRQSAGQSSCQSKGQSRHDDRQKITQTSQTGRCAAKPPAAKAKTAVAKESHKPASKPLKCQIPASAKQKPAAAKPELAATGLIEGGKAPASACPATAATASRWPTMPARNWCCFSTRAPTPPAAPGKPSTSPGSRATLPPNRGAAVLGVSADTVKAQESFRNKHDLTAFL